MPDHRPVLIEQAEDILLRMEEARDRLAKTLKQAKADKGFYLNDFRQSISNALIACRLIGHIPEPPSGNAPPYTLKQLYKGTREL